MRQVAVQTYSRILKQRCLANYNTRICLSIYLDFLYACWDVGCCGPCYLRPVWHGLVRTGHTVPCCINTGLFILRTHNDAAVPVPKAPLFSRPPPFLPERGSLAGSHRCPHFECSNGALDAHIRVWGVFLWQHSAAVAQLFVLNDCSAFGIIIRDFSICNGDFYTEYRLAEPPSGPSPPTFLIFLHVSLIACTSSSFSSDRITNSLFLPNEITFESGYKIKRDELYGLTWQDSQKRDKLWKSAFCILTNIFVEINKHLPDKCFKKLLLPLNEAVSIYTCFQHCFFFNLNRKVQPFVGSFAHWVCMGRLPIMGLPTVWWVFKKSFPALHLQQPL